MKVSIKPGEYVLAVSGGVDSMVLLDLLAKQPRVKLIVAHFNHGIREDSDKDEALVKKRAEELNLPFAVGYGQLGAGASEAAARNARYGFLRSVKAQYRARAIITAHHQDDLIETALLNILRGTGRKGLTSLSNGQEIVRPLLEFSKKDIITYAKQAKLSWHEDSTNKDIDYLRNYLRYKFLPRLTNRQRKNLICNLDKVAKLNIRIDNEIATLSHYVSHNDQIDRQSYANLPASLGSELLSYWLRRSAAGEFDRLTISRLDLAIRTARPGALQPIKGDVRMEVDKSYAHLRNRLGKVVNGLI